MTTCQPTQLGSPLFRPEHIACNPSVSWETGLAGPLLTLGRFEFWQAATNTTRRGNPLCRGKKGSIITLLPLLRAVPLRPIRKSEPEAGTRWQ